MSLTTYLEKILPVKKIDIFGKDSLMMTSIPYYMLTFLLVLCYFLIENHAWSLLAFVYVLMPFLDEICTQDGRNPNKQEQK
jgi:hypothetical protein